MKNLKIAEIVPVKYLPLTRENQYHMCLAPAAIENAEYRRFYRTMREEGKYVLADNGAAEGDKLSYRELIEVYQAVKPTEIVLPDVLGDAKETIKRSTEFYKTLEEEIKDYKTMIVPQGKTWEEWCSCAETLFNSVRVNTVGIPKILKAILGEEEARVRASEYLSKFETEVHLLGCSERPGIVARCRQVNEYVRGCDSSFAYICSKKKIKNITEHTPRYHDAFNVLEDTDASELERLLKEFEKSTGVQDNLKDKTWEE